MRKFLLLLFLPSFLVAQVKVKLKATGNLYEVNCNLNGKITAPFLLDTGASDTMIPPSLANALILTKTLSAKDTLPSMVYTLANGQIVYYKRFKLKSLKIGSVVIRNVVCSVSNQDNSVLLLGQSALKRLRQYKIDNKTKTLYLWVHQ